MFSDRSGWDWSGFKNQFPSHRSIPYATVAMTIRNGPQKQHALQVLEQGTTTQVIRKQNGDSEWESASSPMLSDVCIGPAQVAWNENRTSSHLETRLEIHLQLRQTPRILQFTAVELWAQTDGLPRSSQVYHSEQFTCSLGQFDLKMSPNPRT